jgi:glutaryl-CoA dehydrogenase (non-decarboxylating)
MSHGEPTRMTAEHQARVREFRTFATEVVLPRASEFDRQEAVPRDFIAGLAERGYLGTLVAPAHGGQGQDFLTYGLLHEAMGAACSSIRSLLTVHSMVCQALQRCGSERLRETYLPALATGRSLGAFCLTEPRTGSDGQALEAEVREGPDGELRLTGHKKWITFGQIADLFLVFAKLGGRPVAVLVERTRPGVAVTPIRGMLGARGSMLAEIVFEDCPVERSSFVGGVGFGWSGVASMCLDLGRYSVAWGCVGMARASLELAMRHADERVQFGVKLREHQLVRRLLTDMITNVEAARLLCLEAGRLRDEGDLRALHQTLVAKYFASRAASDVTRDAVQLHGASGCSGEVPVERFFRDAKVMEIIEGSTEIQQDIIARLGLLDPAGG